MEQFQLEPPQTMDPPAKLMPLAVVNEFAVNDATVTVSVYPLSLIVPAAKLKAPANTRLFVYALNNLKFEVYALIVKVLERLFPSTSKSILLPPAPMG